MLNVIVELCSYIKQVTYFGLVLSYKTGQLIIYGLQTLIQVLVQINNNIGAALLVLFEDFFVFLYDVAQRIGLVFAVICNIFEKVMNCIVSVIETIKFVVLTIALCATQTYNAIFETIAKVFTGFGHILLTIKYFILLIGSGIWFALTLIPLAIVYTCTMFTYYIGSVIDESINIIKNFKINSKLLINNTYEFITDVPLESMVGLFVGVCLFYILIKFHIFVYRKVVSALELIRQNIQRVRLRLARLTIRRPVQEVSSLSGQSNSDDENNSDSDDSACNESRLCIICHDRRKCMLMLPCRHVCLCNICNVRLRNYNRNCPICRTVVQKTMKVFV